MALVLAAGEQIDDRYKLIRRVGSGGMADVWLADDEQLGRQVALKFLHERFAQDKQFVERFRREARAAAGLQHPNVVGVYDRGEHEGVPYIAMEYVEGASLKELIGKGLTVGEAVEITRQILAGARFAHGRGIVHRDLKPQNILVDADGRARVTDFGIARAGASEITETGSVLGTAHYLSPEQAQGHEITAASDLYSVGVILYEALTGEVPFDGDSAVTVALKQVSERPSAPSAINHSVSSALDAVVLRALAKDPSKRFANAVEFTSALDAAEADPSGGGLGDTASYAPVVAPDAGEEDLAEEWRYANGRRGFTGRQVAIGAAVLLLAALAAFALTRPAEVAIPSVIDKSETEARAILEEAGFDVAAKTFPICAPRGTVTEQSPLPGTKADEGSTVTLSVSLGQSVRMPDLEDAKLAEAIRELRDVQLLVDTRRKPAKRVEEGRVINTDPPKGTTVDCQEAVTLVVSKGAVLVTMPSVIGQQREIAESTLRREDLIVNVETRDADAPEGEVVDQSPSAGSQVETGDEVTIVVSTGAGSVVVRDVEGHTRQSAASILRSQGLNVNVVKQSTGNPAEDNRVLDQAPEGGTRVRRGETVTIFVGKF